MAIVKFVLFVRLMVQVAETHIDTREFANYFIHYYFHLPGNDLN